MQKIGQLRKRVSIMELSEIPDGDFGITDTLTSIGKVWAKIEETAGTRLYLGKNIDSETTHMVVMRYRKTITSENWIRYLETNFRIRGVTDAYEMSHRFTILQLEVSTKEFTA